MIRHYIEAEGSMSDMEIFHSLSHCGNGARRELALFSSISNNLTWEQDERSKHDAPQQEHWQ